MKKKFTVLLLSLAALLLLAGCAAQTGTESEPDTDSRTMMHTIDRDQTVVYRFHLKKNSAVAGAVLNLTLLDRDTDTGAQAENRCVAYIGNSRAMGGKSGYARLFTEIQTAEGALPWDISSGFDGKWRLMAPGNMRSVDDVDMLLRLSRNGETLRATLDIDGARAWDAQQTVKNLGDETRCFYLNVDNYTLSAITFSDAGTAGWLPSVWLRILLMPLLLVGTFLIHLFAKKIAEDHIFLVDGGLSLTTGVWGICLLLLGTLLYIHFGGNIVRNLYYLPLPLPADGAAFWIISAVLALVAVGITIFLIWLAFDDLGNPFVYLFGALALGILQALWVASIAIIVCQLLDQIVDLIMAILGIVAMAVVAIVLFSSPGKGYKEVYTTTYTYKNGSLVDTKIDIDYVKIDDKKD